MHGRNSDHWKRQPSRLCHTLMFAALANRPSPPPPSAAPPSAAPPLEQENAALLQRIARLEAIVEVLSEDQQTATAAELQVEAAELRQRLRDHEAQREVHVALLSKLQDQLQHLQEQASAEQARAKTEQVGYEAKVCALSWLVRRQQSLAHELRGQVEPSHLPPSPSLLPPSPAETELAEAQLAEALRCLSSCADSLAEHEASSDAGATAAAERAGACDTALSAPFMACTTAAAPPTGAAPTGQRRVASPLSRTPPPAGAVARCSPVHPSSTQRSVAEAAAAADLAAEAAGAAAVTLAVMPTLCETAASLSSSLDALDAAMPLVRSGLSTAAVAGQPGPWGEGGGPTLPHEELQPRLATLEQQTRELRAAIDAADPIKEARPPRPTPPTPRPLNRCAHTAAPTPPRPSVCRSSSDRAPSANSCACCCGKPGSSSATQTRGTEPRSPRRAAVKSGAAPPRLAAPRVQAPPPPPRAPVSHRPSREWLVGLQLESAPPRHDPVALPPPPPPPRPLPPPPAPRHRLAARKTRPGRLSQPPRRFATSRAGGLVLPARRGRTAPARLSRTCGARRRASLRARRRGRR